MSGPLATAICMVASHPTAPAQAPAVPPVTLPRLVPAAASAAAFAPPGWVLEQSSSGDLNKDGRADLVAVLKGADPRCMVETGNAAARLDTNPRLLLVAFGTPSGYTLQLANGAVIPRLDAPYMDDPLDEGGAVVSSGTVRISLRHWRSAGGWSTSSVALSFRWDGSQFRMIGLDRHDLQRNSGATQDLSVNYLTGRVKTVTGSIDGEAQEPARWSRLRTGPPPTLANIGNGLDFAAAQP